jgi:phosphoglucomutase
MISGVKVEINFLHLSFWPHSYDALHGVAGVYAKKIFVEELGAKESSLLNCTPLVKRTTSLANRSYAYV